MSAARTSWRRSAARCACTGESIGHYLLSVQDDLGYVKIETHFLGAPLVMRIGAKAVPVDGLLAPGPATIPDTDPSAIRHVSYQAYSFDASAYPSGPLRISVLVPLPAALSQAELLGDQEL